MKAWKHVWKGRPAGMPSRRCTVDNANEVFQFCSSLLVERKNERFQEYIENCWKILRGVGKKADIPIL